MADPAITAAVQYVTGPVHCFARFPDPNGNPIVDATVQGAGPILYLGTCEETPEVQLAAHWKKSKNDLAGDFIGFDQEFHGMDGLVVMDLNKKNHSNLDGLLQVPRPVTVTAGQADIGWDRLGIGSLLLANGCAFELWLQYSFFGTANARAYPDLPPGLYFRACAHPERLKAPSGTRVAKDRVVCEIQPVYNRATGGFFLGSSRAAYFTALPTPS